MTAFGMLAPAHEPSPGARTTESARTGNWGRADSAVRAPDVSRFMVPMPFKMNWELSMNRSADLRIGALEDATLEHADSEIGAPAAGFIVSMCFKMNWQLSS